MTLAKILGTAASACRCRIPGCTNLSSVAAGNGRAKNHCRYHVQFKARHGSHWHWTYRAADLKPYMSAATQWLAQVQSNADVAAALSDLELALASSGHVIPAPKLRGRPAADRACIAFARLREANVKPIRLLATYLGVAALIEDDRGSHRTREFQLVQAAKAVHRLASGTHKRWQMWNPLGHPVATELHAYPRSSGLVLRKIGERLERAADRLRARAVPEIIALKTARFGPHPSHLPEWRPAWAGRTVSA